MSKKRKHCEIEVRKMHKNPWILWKKYVKVVMFSKWSMPVPLWGEVWNFVPLLMVTEIPSLKVPEQNAKHHNLSYLTFTHFMASFYIIMVVFWPVGSYSPGWSSNIKMILIHDPITISYRIGRSVWDVIFSTAKFLYNRLSYSLRHVWTAHPIPCPACLCPWKQLLELFIGYLKLFLFNVAGLSRQIRMRKRVAVATCCPLGG